MTKTAQHTPTEHLDKLIPLSTNATRNFYHDQSTRQEPMLRVYKSTLENVTVQIRRELEYITASITMRQAIELRDALTQIIAEFGDA